ncbi:heavy-metal-associated domain-containing protein [Pedobacter sp. PWIIR3]
MHTFKFKTNIKCDACIAKVTPYLDGLGSIDNWKVDLQNPDRVLSIETEEALNPKEVIMLLDQVGYHAEKI